MGRIIFVNAQTERMFGYQREDLLGQPLEVLMPETYRSGHERHRQAFMAAPATRSMGAGRDLLGRRKDGSTFPIEIGLNPVHFPEGDIVLASIVDISERKRAEAAATEVQRAAAVSVLEAQHAVAAARRRFIRYIFHELVRINRCTYARNACELLRALVSETCHGTRVNICMRIRILHLL